MHFLNSKNLTFQPVIKESLWTIKISLLKLNLHFSWATPWWIPDIWIQCWLSPRPKYFRLRRSCSQLYRVVVMSSCYVKKLFWKIARDLLGKTCAEDYGVSAEGHTQPARAPLDYCRWLLKKTSSLLHLFLTKKGHNRNHVSHT